MSHTNSFNRRTKKIREAQERQEVRASRSPNMQKRLVLLRNAELKAAGKPCEAKRELAILDALIAEQN